MEYDDEEYMYEWEKLAREPVRTPLTYEQWHDHMDMLQKRKDIVTNLQRVAKDMITLDLEMKRDGDTVDADKSKRDERSLEQSMFKLQEQVREMQHLLDFVLEQRRSEEEQEASQAKPQYKWTNIQPAQISWLPPQSDGRL